MPRAATTSDVFNAIAEPKRRELLELLAREGVLAVGTMVDELGLPQPAVSKHLGVLKKVGLVAMSKEGRQRFYKLQAEELKPVFTWIKQYERFWTEHVDRIKQRAERMAREARNKEH